MSEAAKARIFQWKGSYHEFMITDCELCDYCAHSRSYSGADRVADSHHLNTAPTAEKRRYRDSRTILEPISVLKGLKPRTSSVDTSCATPPRSVHKNAAAGSLGSALTSSISGS
jgi:hypothetical protein